MSGNELTHGIIGLGVFFGGMAPICPFLAAQIGAAAVASEGIEVLWK